jgi:acyl carrier protein
MSVDERLRRVFSDVFGVDGTLMRDESSPHTIEAWDSIAHLNLILALEGEFGVQFEAEDIPDLVSFGAIRRRVERLDGSAA